MRLLIDRLTRQARLTGTSGCRGGRDVKLYTYFRSSAAYRVRIALNLKGVAYDSVSINLLKVEQREEGYRAINPQGRVPSLDIGAATLIQSPAILEYLDEVLSGTAPAAGRCGQPRQGPGRCQPDRLRYPPAQQFRHDRLPQESARARSGHGRRMVRPLGP